MKNIVNKKSGILLVGAMAVAMVFSSCKKDFDRINTDPNNPEDVPNTFFLSGAQRGLMDNTSDVWWGANMGNQLAQYWSSNQYSSESRYLFRTAITNTYWNLFYDGGQNDALVAVGGLMELQRIIDNCKNDSIGSSRYGYVNNQIAVATVLRVWMYQNITDAWGDAPYSQALLADANKSPKYDAQSDIYAGLISELNTAIGLIDQTQEGPWGDLIYDSGDDHHSGDMAKWFMFANSLKMRVALRMADVTGSNAQTYFEEAATAGPILSNADNALLPYGEFPGANLIYYNRVVSGRNDYCASNTFLDNTLTPLNDPRRECFFRPRTSDNTFVGEVYGLSEANAAGTPNSTVSQRSALAISPTLPGIYMDYAQVEFMLAEAAERGWAAPGGDAEFHYKAGITASIEYWTGLNGSPADINAYLAQDSVNYATAIAGTLPELEPAKHPAWKHVIGKQKWIALCNQGIQGWSEWRRLDFGILQMPADGPLEGTGIPLRIKYPVDEQTLNAAHYAAAVSNQGGSDDQATRLWWDKN